MVLPKASFESKSKWANGQEISCKIYDVFAILSYSLCKPKLFISIGIEISPMLGSLRHPIDKAGSKTSLSSEDAFPNNSLSARNLKLFINDSDRKEIGNNVDVTGRILASYVQQNKINTTDNDSDS